MKSTVIVEDAFAKLIRLRLCNKMQNNYTLLTRLFIFCCCEAFDKQLRLLASKNCPQTALESSVQSELLSMYRKQQH